MTYIQWGSKVAKKRKKKEKKKVVQSATEIRSLFRSLRHQLKNFSR